MVTMFSDISSTLDKTTVHYPISDSKLPFAQYISQTRAIIEERRIDLQQQNAAMIIEANCPFELRPAQPVMSGDRIKYGALLIHGLLDSPFSLRDIGNSFQDQGILCRSILLPGHGTNPTDMFSVSYHDWIQAVRYGVESLKNEVEQIYLVGYSTGATLSVYQALHDSHINGIILLSPAIKIRAPVDTIVNWRYLTNWMTKRKRWIFKDIERDYAKYRSVTFNAPLQVSRLTNVVKELMLQHSLITPIFMAISREDETISSHKAIDFFSSLGNRDSKMLLYTSCAHKYPDSRIEPRLSLYPELHIKHLSHISIPFSPDNPHYGQHGDFEFASVINQPNTVYGAYSHFERKALKLLNSMHLLKKEYKELTYNPDFKHMTNELINFIKA